MNTQQIIHYPLHWVVTRYFQHMCKGAMESTHAVDTIQWIYAHVQRTILYIAKQKMALAHNKNGCMCQTETCPKETLYSTKRGDVSKLRIKSCTAWNLSMWTRVQELMHIATRVNFYTYTISSYTVRHVDPCTIKNMYSTTCVNVWTCTTKFCIVPHVSIWTPVQSNHVQYDTCRRGYVCKKIAWLHRTIQSSLYSTTRVNPDMCTI